MTGVRPRRLAVVTLVALAAGVLAGPEAARAPTAVEYLVGLGVGKVVDVPFRATANLELDVDHAFPALPPGEQLGLLGVIELLAPSGLMEEEGLRPGASVQVIDNATGRTGLVVIAIRNRVR